MQTHRIATLVPLAVGVPAVVCTIVIHALPLSATVNFIRREKRQGMNIRGTNGFQEKRTRYAIFATRSESIIDYDSDYDSTASVPIETFLTETAQSEQL